MQHKPFSLEPFWGCRTWATPPRDKWHHTEESNLWNNVRTFPTVWGSQQETFYHLFEANQPIFWAHCWCFPIMQWVVYTDRSVRKQTFTKPVCCSVRLQEQQKHSEGSITWPSCLKAEKTRNSAYVAFPSCLCEKFLFGVRRIFLAWIWSLSRLTLKLWC